MKMAFRCTCTPMSDVHSPISTHPSRSAFKIGLQGPETESTMPLWEGLEGVVREKAQEFIQ